MYVFVYIYIDTHAHEGKESGGTSWRLIRIKIWDLPADTVAQSVERLCDKPRVCVRILANARFFIYSVVFFLLCYPGEVLGGPISTGVCTM